MGGCSCVNRRDDGDLNTGLSMEIIKKFKDNKQLLNQLIKVQSKVRGLIIRNKLKSIRPKKFMPNDSSYRYIQVLSDKIKESDMTNLFIKYPPLNDGVEVQLRQTVEYENKAVFWGEWSVKDNTRYGRGIQVWNDGSRYEGYWKNDKANVRGKLTHHDGDVYSGEWNDDKAEGFGTYIHQDGGKYEGYWKDDKQEGRGIESWTDGTSYEGDYKDGRKSGNGKFKWGDGSVYEGHFENNNINGKGTYIWADKRKYTGGWKDNKMDGLGCFTWPDNRKYQGGYKDDKKEGYGEFEWADGRKYQGMWKGGKQQGEGRFYNPNSKRWKKGYWEEGRRIRWINEVKEEEGELDGGYKEYVNKKGGENNGYEYNDNEGEEDSKGK